MTGAAILLTSLLLAGQAQADPAWRLLTSDHFQMYTTAGERKARDTLLYFEQANSFFLQAFKLTGASGTVRIIAFNSEKEYAPYRLNEFASAYYLKTGERDYIVLSNTGSGHYPVAVHEYIHLLINRFDRELPPWFNEGLAEFYSTLRPSGGKVIAGEIIPARYLILHNERWLDLATLLAVDHDSPYYNEKQRAGIFYAESWALVHMLMLSDTYRPKFGDLLAALQPGVTPADAFQKAYGRPLSEVQKDLVAYLHATSFRSAVFEVRLSKSAAAPEVAPADPGDLGGCLIDLLAGANKLPEASSLAARMARENPRSPRIEEAWAYLVWRADPPSALRHFARAAELGSTTPRLYLDYGRMLASTDGVAAEKAFRKALELEPGSIPAAIQLAQVDMRQSRFPEALARLQALRNVPRTEAFSWFYTVAYCSYRMDNSAQARSAISRARPLATASGQSQALDDLSAALDRKDTATYTALRRAPDTPGIARPDPQSVEQEAPPPAFHGVFAEGVLREVVCRGATALLRLEGGDKPGLYLIRDPKLISVENAKGQPVDFACGPQKPARRLRIGYQPGTDPELGSSGIVRSIAFLP